jgi:hypothetical protein
MLLNSNVRNAEPRYSHESRKICSREMFARDQPLGLMPIHEYCISLNLLYVWKREAYACYGSNPGQNL